MQTSDSCNATCRSQRVHLTVQHTFCSRNFNILYVQSCLYCIYSVHTVHILFTLYILHLLFDISISFILHIFLLWSLLLSHAVNICIVGLIKEYLILSNTISFYKGNSAFDCRIVSANFEKKTC